MTFVCDQCGNSAATVPNRTATRQLCDACFSGYQGAAAGLLSGGGVSGAIATSGWFSRLRESRKKN